jgi:Amt family ammonium transporter
MTEAITEATREAVTAMVGREEDAMPNSSSPVYPGSGWNVQNWPSMVLNTTSTDPEVTWDDATWILTSSFIIFTMQSGFGLLEAGNVSAKNEVNIMIKNAVDVVFGGLTYWMFGYGLSFGMEAGTNWFCGVGYWCVHTDKIHEMGALYSTFFFQLSFATTATTIVSGSMAERTKLTSYIIFSLLNTIIYCIPAHWLWASNGFLYKLGAVDIAGSGGVHLLGAVSGMVAAVMLGPRKGRYDKGTAPLPLGNGTNCMVGMFMLWWGWLGFNCGSTFGISGGKWILAAKTAVTTINGSMGGGFVAIAYTYIMDHGKYDVSKIVNGILGSLVSITAPCALVEPYEAVIIGAIGSLIVLAACPLLDRLHIDDPVAAVPVHGIGGMWGMISVGLFVAPDGIIHLSRGRAGVFHGGGFYLLGVQALSILCIAAWSGLITFILLSGIKLANGIRMSEEHEMLGADAVEHSINKMSPINSIDNIKEFIENLDADLHKTKVKRGAFGLSRLIRLRKKKSQRSLEVQDIENPHAIDEKAKTTEETKY